MDTNPSKVTKVAQNELGYLEKKSNAQLDDKTANAGDKNFTKYWRDLKPDFQQEPWCNAFVNWIFVQAFGETEAKKLLCTDGAWSYYTPTSASYFKNKKQWYTSPKIGDIIFFKNNTRINHVGYVYKIDSSRVYTIEGNTDAGSEVIPNGGSVAAKSYVLANSRIAGYGRPKYSSTATSTQVVNIPVSSSRAGLKIVGTTSLNIRKTPKDGEIIGTYKGGELVQITAKAKASDNTYWFKTDKGYISGKYVEGWVKETCEKWWFVELGYKYPAGILKEIDNKWYAFDNDGWMLDASRFNSDGSIK